MPPLDSIEALLGAGDPGLAQGVEQDLLVARTEQALFGTRPPELQLGRYTVLERVGRGGGGAVYRGHDPQLQRTVAIKVVARPGAGSDHLRRLAVEAEALAQLHHPNVVQVYDVLLQPEHSRVVMIMEWIDGCDLARWLGREDRRKPEIVAAFVAAGRGLEAAHRAGLVHRDFKPANVLISEAGRVCVADFGLAHADGSRSDAAPAGTPAYMAPEQWHAAALTTRTDQYAFCAALAEALGQSTGADDRAAVLAALPRSLRGALARGLSVDPARRFASMAALLARLQPARSRLRRAWPLVAGLGLFGAVAGFAALHDEQPSCETAADRLGAAWTAARPGTTAHLAQQSGQRVARHADRTLTAYAHRWRDAYATTCQGALPPDEVARRRRCFASLRWDVQGLVTALGSEDDPQVDRALAALPAPLSCNAPTEAGLRGWAPDDPDARERADVFQRRLAEITGRSSAGHYADAVPEFEALLAEYDDPALAPARLQANLRLASALGLAGHLDQSRAVLTEAYYDAQAAGHDREAAQAATNLVFLVGYQLADPTAGLTWSRHADAALRRLDLGGEPRAELLSFLGSVAAQRGDAETSRRHHEAALAIREPFASERPVELAHTLNNLGNVMLRARDYDAARRYHTRCLEIRRSVYGDAHPAVATSLNNLGSVQLFADGPAAAKPTFKRALAIWETTLGPEHHNVTQALYNLSAIALQEERWDDADTLVDRALAIAEPGLPQRHPMVSMLHSAKAEILLRRGEHQGAHDAFARLLVSQRARLGDDDQDVASTLNEMGRALGRLGDYARAVERFGEAEAAYRNALGPAHPKRLVPIRNEGLARLRLGQTKHALVLLEAARNAGATRFSTDERAELDHAIARARRSLGERS